MLARRRTKVQLISAADAAVSDTSLVTTTSTAAKPTKIAMTAAHSMKEAIYTFGRLSVEHKAFFNTKRDWAQSLQALYRHMQLHFTVAGFLECRNSNLTVQDGENLRKSILFLSLENLTPVDLSGKF